MRNRCREVGAVALALSLAGCGIVGMGGGAGVDPTSGLVLAWSQAEHPDLMVGSASRPGPRTRLASTTVQRATALSELPPSVPASERAKVDAVDLTTHVLVFAVYSRCTETSRVARDGEVLRVVVERDEDTMCAWAPTQVDVWSVARQGLPTPVELLDQRGEPAPGG